MRDNANDKHVGWLNACGWDRKRKDQTTPRRDEIRLFAAGC